MLLDSMFSDVTFWQTMNDVEFMLGVCMDNSLQMAPHEDGPPISWS